MLLKLADNKDADYAVAEAVDRNFDKLPTNVQNLLFKLADNKVRAYWVAHNLDKLPEGLRIKLLTTLSKYNISYPVLDAIACYFL